jgi:helicase required for RNAi-mediated heterochromatin assembly 1
MSSNNSNVSIIVDHVKRDYGLEDGIESWRQLPEIPTSGEILGPVNRLQNDSDSDDDSFDDSKSSHEPDLPINPVMGAWRSKGEYIGAHYQLLREDAIAPLRQAVALYRSQPAMKDSQELSIYTHVRRSILIE